MEVGIERIRRERAAIVDERPAIIALLFEHVGQIEIRFHVVRLARQASLEGAPRFGTLALVVSHGAQVAVRIRVVGRDLDGRFVGLDRFRPLLGLRVEFATPLEPFNGISARNRDIDRLVRGAIHGVVGLQFRIRIKVQRGEATSALATDVCAPSNSRTSCPPASSSRPS